MFTMLICSKTSLNPRKNPCTLAILGVAALALPLTAAVANAASISVTATVRDFSISYPDFESAIGSEKEILESTLGANGKPVYNIAVKGLTGGSSPTTTGKANFDQWYNDVPGTNHTFTTTLTANETFAGSSIFTYANAAYFPVNGKGFGDEGLSTNFAFTSEIHTSFTYQGGEKLDFTGDEDVWVFINGVLAIDLGGVHPPESDSVSLDTDAATLGITVGGTYDLDIFQAERHTDGSTFNFTTSIVLVDAPDVSEPGLMAVLGLGIAMIGFARRKRAA